MSGLKPCPRCGTKAYLSRDVVDGFYFGWSAGCPRYCHYDGIHGTTIDADLINQVVAEAERASHDAEFKKQLGLRNLSQEEKKFYEGFKDIKQSVTANQIDIIPTEIIDRTLDDVRKASPILKLVNMAPANVKKWIVASHSGAAVWGNLTDEIKGELSGTISALNIELHMLSAYLVIPKAIRELSIIDTFALERTESNIKVGWGKYYGPMLEHGTRKMSARAHLKPLFEQNKEKYYKKMTECIFG